jgi:hypothetical protein
MFAQLVQDLRKIAPVIGSPVAIRPPLAVDAKMAADQARTSLC